MSFSKDPLWFWIILCCMFLQNNEVDGWRKSPKNPTVTVTKGSVRLVGGSKHCTGLLQIQSTDSVSWHYVCHNRFTAQDALVACRSLNCSFAQSHYGELFWLHQNDSWSQTFSCSGTEQRLVDCPTAALESERDCRPVALKCAEKPTSPEVTVFSLDGSSVERVDRGHSYGIICRVDTPLKVRSFVLAVDGSEWSQRAADNEAHFFPPLTDKSFSFSCRYNFEIYPETFSELQYDFVQFREASYVRLVGEESRCSGVVQLQQGKSDWLVKEWKPVSQRRWSLKEAAVVCRQLNCGSVIRSDSHSTELQSVWKFYSDCDGSERALLSCGSVRKEQSTSTVYVLCSDVLHPANISVSSRKITSQLNSTVVYSPYSFDVTCSVLPQFPGGHFRLVVHGAERFFTLEQAAVKHSAVFTFTFSEKNHSGEYSCVYHNVVHEHHFFSQSHNISLVVKDALDIKLDDGVTRHESERVCSGTLLLEDVSQTMMVTAETLRWDMTHAAIVCRQLGCGSARSTSSVTVSKVFPMWRFFSDCDGSESALLQCGRVKKWFSSKAIHVVCQS